jgi:hypothetical protein
VTRLFRLIVPIACFLIFQGVYAIDISFSASSGGGSVGMTDSYDVGDSVGVSGRSSASFGSGVGMTDSKSLSGSGDANINQVLYGSGGGADYVINYALETFGPSSIEASGSSTLTPVAGGASRSASTTGSIVTTSELWGAQGGDVASVGSYAFLADISTSQSVATGQSVAASQSMNAEGVNAQARSRAVYAEGNYVDIFAVVEDGTLDTSQGVEATNSAEGYQKTVIDGDFAWAVCQAYNPEENYGAYVDNWIDGNAYFEFEGEAAVNDAEARAHQRSYAEGDFIWPWAYSTYKLDERYWAGTYSFESWAWTNANDNDAYIVEL